MKAALIQMSGLILLAAAPASFAASELEAGGRDVSVSLFSARPVHVLTITPLGSSAWIATCARCIHKKFAEPFQFAGPGEIFAGGMLRVSDSLDDTSDGRIAAGLWHLRASRPAGDVDVVLTLPSERYVAAVLNAEAAPNEPPESLRALAILARTFALNGSHFAGQSGHLPADLCDSTQCQAMRLGPISPAIAEAVEATAGETLWFGHRRAEVFFSQSCGGLTEEGGVVWPKLHGLPYLRSRPDPYCLRRDGAAWHAEVSLMEFAAIARSEGWRIPGEVVAARVAERSPSRRALRIVFSDRTGAQSFVAASALRFGMGRALGWDRVRSDNYELALLHGALIFDGRGHGHGVGLCQTGAAEMASEGKDARAILSFYFPGTVVRITPRDDGWHEVRLGTITLWSSDTPSSSQEAAVQRTWADARRRFSPRQPIAAEIVFAPTAELFRQMTAQPGWELASTRGTTVVMQPQSVFDAHGRSASRILLHEMLHVLVEAEASERAPLWLREGLVEELAAESTGASPSDSISTAEIDGALIHADSWASSRRAHSAAAVRVRALIARYGASAVRGWLSSGLPSGLAAGPA